MLAILVVAAVFIPITSFISYRHVLNEVQQAAELRVERLVKLIEKPASTAAYLNDKDLAQEIMSDLKNAPVIAYVQLTLSSGESLHLGEPSNDAATSFILPSHFSDEAVGKIDIVLNQNVIAQQARSDGLFLVAWQLGLLLIILLCMLFIFRWFVVQRLRTLMNQIQQVKLGNDMPEQVIQVSGNDEIAFLANHTNQLIQKIHGLYCDEAAKNLKIATLERQFRMIFENSNAGIALINRNNQVFLSNAAFERLFVVADADKISGQFYLPELFADPYELEDMLNQVRVDQASVFKDFCLQRGKDIWVRVLCSLVEEQHGNLNRFIELVAYDISDRAKQEKVFAYNATHDALTGLYNRRGAEQRFKEQLNYAKQHGRHFILALLDLNDFKPVNDQHGHDAGDVVLKVIGSRLLSVLRADDIIARWGGDEFVVAFVLDDLARLSIILDDIQRLFTIPIEISSDIKVSVGASIGVSQSSVDGYELMQLIESADAAMYKVKHAGKGDYHIAEKQPTDSIV
ncbi:hypothetical protein HR45_08650 [Shewanella mangrovi]|uniref:Diguanylate cyclase n=2 Tax=Shewanella mangrovi TaxID=1515746 RepID=A0A094JZU4_9GAMM|nr:hypothetical protein HR45_08650 [Shewanella mangrovi]